MKPKSLSKKLFLSKVSISNLSVPEMFQVKGGYHTDPNTDCWTLYKDTCYTELPTYCPTFRFPACSGLC